MHIIGTRRLRALLLPLAAVVAAPAGVRAQERADSGAFLMRLGADTVAVERWLRSGDTIRSLIVTRSPRTAVRQYVVVLGPDGAVRSFASAPEGQPLEFTNVSGENAIPLAGPTYVPYQIAVQRALRAGGERLTVSLIAGGQSLPVEVRRTGDRTFATTNQFGIPLSITVDAQGRIESVDAGGGSTVERLRWVDLHALAGDFRRRDEAGRGLGPLSPRDTARSAVDGASIEVDYGRPSLRGRELSLLVPDGQVWRMGANAATHLRTDLDLRFGDVQVPAGTYTLFALPAASGWTLIFNRETGQGGLDYDPSRDLGRVEMQVRRDRPPAEQFTIEVVDTERGGELRLLWGTVEATAPFSVGS